MGPNSRNDASREYRFQAGLPADLQVGGHEYECTAHDLSRTGVLLTGEIPQPVGAQVCLVLKSSTRDLEARLRGEVTRAISGTSESQPGVAIKFAPLDDAQSEVIEALLARVMEGLVPAPLMALKPGALPLEVRKALDSIPLPHRIALAGRAAFREREFLRQDPNPPVLEALARNPSLSPPEAHALAALPGILSTTIEILARDPRWTGDEELKLALASHPHAPAALSDKLVSQLGAPALERMLRRSSLTTSLRGKILRRLGRRA